MQHQQHSYKALVIVVIICIGLLVGLGYSSYKQHIHNQEAPKIARNAKLKKLHKEHQRKEDAKENRKANKQVDAEETAQQKAIDRDADKPNKHVARLRHIHINHKAKHQNVVQRKQLNKQALFNRDINRDRLADKKFTKAFVYSPRQHQITVIYNHHGQILMRKKRWRRIKLGINKQLNNQDNQLHRLNQRIHFRVL